MIQYLGKLLIFIGTIFIIIGIILLLGHKLADKLPFNIGHLPGDIIIKKENFTFYFPITTSIIVSLILTLILFLFSRK